MLSPNVIIVWPGTNAAIPTGFNRETSLDGKFPKGTADATNPNVGGGTDTHTHSSSSHTHALNAHTHTYTLTNTTGGNQGSASAGNAESLDGQHTHTGTSGAANGGTTAGTGVTYAAFSSLPPYYEVIFIKASGWQSIPQSSIVLWGKTSTAPTGFAICDGNGGTPDLRGKYLRGAATGADAGGTGGSTTNNHTIAHGHTANTHTHDAANSGSQVGEGGCNRFDYNINLIYRYHTHSISMAAGTQNVTDYAGAIGAQSETVEPAYTKLGAIKNTSAQSLIPVEGMIALWLGTLATIPAGWVVCDGNNGTTDMRSRHLKVATTFSELGNTGGANTHTHAAQAHSHTASGSHNHTATGTSHTASAGHDGGGAEPPLYTVTHGQSVATSAPNYANANTTADSSNNEPAYLTVAYIQYKFSVGGGALFALA